MLLTLLASLLLSVAQAVVVPSNPGPFSVAMRVKALTDHGRTDPFNSTAKRQVLLSVFVPIPDNIKCGQDVVSYMTPATAASYAPLAESAGLPGALFSTFQLEFCKTPQQNGGCRASKKKGPRFPLVFFSPGLGESRLLYSVTAKSIAAQGCVVVTIDHPYDADVVEFPDGSVVRRNWTTGMEQQLTEIRAADISFTLTKLGQLTQKGPLFHDLPATRIDLTKVIAMGHSLGGAAAALAVRQDERIRGGIDLDGRLFSPVLESGLVGGGPNNKDKDKNKNKNKNKPFMLLGREKHADEDPTWNQFWRVLRGTSGGQGAMVAVKGTSHFSFADLPPLMQALGLPDEVKGQVEAMLGVVDGARMQRILASFLASFFKWAFEGSHGPFEEVVGGFEEAVIRNSTFLAV